MRGGGSPSPSPEKGDVSGAAALRGLVLGLSPRLLRPPPSPVRWTQAGPEVLGGA